MEFGMDLKNEILGPECIFQFKPFLKKEYADFKIDSTEELYDDGNIVFGITPKEGIIKQVSNNKNSKSHGDNDLSGIQVNLHQVLNFELKKLNRKPLDLTIFTDANGIFEHEDVAVTRRSPITIYTPEKHIIDTSSESSQFKLYSDGYRIKVEKL